MAHDAVHMAVIDQRAGMAVVGAQDEVARVNALFRHGFDLFGDVVPCRTETQHRLHALAYAGDRIVGAGAFMVVFRTAGEA